MPQTIVRGNTVTLDAYFRDNSNALADPDDPQISILDPEGATVVSLDTPTRASIGHFQYEYPVDAHAELGAWAARWFGSIDGDALEDEDGFTVIAGFVVPGPDSSLVSLVDFADFIQLPLDTIDEDHATRCLLGASSLVRQELGQALELITDDVFQVESPGGRLLLLPELPVIDVTLVRERRPGGDWTELTAGTDYEVVLGRAGKVWRLDHEWPRAISRGLNGFIEVTYSHGDTTVDPLVATVVNRVAARGYANPEAVQQETTGHDTTNYGFVAGLYLSNEDKKTLPRPGGRGGSR